MVTLKRLRADTAKRLSAVSGDCAGFDADLLIEKATGIDLKGFDMMGDREVDSTDLEPLIERRLSGEPTQYILGEWEFFGLPFYVGEGVLIPRPDTEVLVEKALELIKDIKAPKILDLCAGSGCISIALKHHRSDATVTAVELFEGAKVYLERNIERNRVDVEIRTFDVLKKPDGFTKYDLIVSNPPYIDAIAMTELDSSVLREPETALYGGEDGLDFYRAIAKNWCPLLTEKGSVAVEIGYDQGESVANILKSNGFVTTLYKDYGGNPRVIIGTHRGLY